jgi:hypothetical protein
VHSVGHFYCFAINLAPHNATCVRILWHVTRQAVHTRCRMSNRFLRWQQWFVFPAHADPILRNRRYKKQSQYISVRKRRRIIAVISKTNRDLLLGYEQKWVIGVTSAMWQGGQTHWAHMGYNKTRRVSLSICGSHLHSFPPSSCADFIKCVNELRITQ